MAWRLDTREIGVSGVIYGASGFHSACTSPSTVMPGLVPGIHVLAEKEDVDGRDEPGHDDV